MGPCIGVNSTITYMKTLSIVLPISFVALAALAPAYVLTAPAIATYAAAFVLLISTSEYMPRVPRWQAELRANASFVTSPETLRLAA